MQKNKKSIKNSKRPARINLAKMSYKLESTFPIDPKVLYIEKDEVLKKEDILNNYQLSYYGKIENQLKSSSEKLERRIEQLSLNIDNIQSRTKTVSEEDKKQILKALEKRNKEGTVNKSLDELTVELSHKVKQIRRVTKRAKKILDSSTLVDKKNDDSITLEEYKVLKLPYKSLRAIVLKRKIILFYAIGISFFLVLLIALLVAFLV